MLLETEWVLRVVWELSSREILSAFEELAGLPNVEVEDSTNVTRAIQWSASGMDFADALHLASCGDASEFATFDRKFSRRAAAMAQTAVIPL